ncbi:diguanylate cyclase [Actinoplanes sp. NPDC089786]|uniref:diguanylate cyclase domain-containing protein n=1 Tax=Actinoplanes sp. NPDC089786 TaxID=3155185 RepID=UPI003421FA65
MLYENERTVVTRVVLPAGNTVVRKEALGPDGELRMCHERAMLRRLAGLEQVAKLVDDGAADDDAIQLVDLDGVALDSLLGPEPLGLAELLTLAVDLAEVLAAVHGRGVVHKDVNPSNILLAGMPRRPSLIDFDLATTFAEERPGFLHPDQIAGTLVYLAPEQTGRTGRSVDHRADLYSLGATLYELATGVPPFGSEDPLRLIHDHLVRNPVRPDQVNPALPAGLSDLLLRLLDKEPDRRYQSAAGLAHDLVRMRDEFGRGEQSGFPLGERDFPLRLAAPSGLVGRDAEIATLGEAFEDALIGNCRGVLVSGVPGVGKSSLIDELRPIASACGGWFVSGKFDQYRDDPESDGLQQSLRRLCQLLLAEPESDVLALRASFDAALGANVALLAATVPEFALLVGHDAATAPAASNVRANRDQMVQAVLDFLYAVAASGQPVALVLDDLQWAGPAATALVDAVFTEPERGGLLLVGAYRDGEVDVTHPLTTMLSRLKQPGTAVRHIRLHNLPVDDLGALLTEMLRLAPERAAELAQVVAARTGGNPYDSLELLNALRREGALIPGAEGWLWDPAAVQRHLGQADVVELLSARINALPAETGAALETMACLGGDMAPDLLAAACGRSGEALSATLLPALEDGLLMMEQSSGAVRFRHDRVQQAASARLAPRLRPGFRVQLGRRLAAVPQLRGIAAKQYLPAIDLVIDHEERRRVVGLFRETALDLRIHQPAMAERLLRAAVSLLGTDPVGVDDRSLATVETEWHAALFVLGDLDQADDVYRSIEQHCVDPLERVAAAGVQIASLSNRNRHAEALELGMNLLARLGLPVPGPDEMGATIGRGVAALTAWAADDARADDRHRPETKDPIVLAISALMNSVKQPAFLGSPSILAWLLVEAQRLWVAHGPCEALTSVLSGAGFITASAGQDYRTGYSVGRYLIAMSETHGYEIGGAQARLMSVANAAHWFEPLEDVLRDARRTRANMVRLGDLQSAGITYTLTILAMFDSMPTLAELLAEVEAGLAFSHRTGNQSVAELLTMAQQVIQPLHGDDDSLVRTVPAEPPAEIEANGAARATFHLYAAIVSVIAGDFSRLDQHVAVTSKAMPMFPGMYPNAVYHLLHGLALANRVVGAASTERTALLAELDASRQWLAARAMDAPANFTHLSRLLDAERAGAVGDTLGAISAFDAALREPGTHPRPWHRALIGERAGLFHLAHGLEHTGRALLAEARQGYAAWGAVAKARSLDRQYPFLAQRPANRPEPQRGRTIETRRSSGFSSESVDLLGVLDASRALSSETDLRGLRARVSDVLSAMTGATSVQVVSRDDDSRNWYMADPVGEPSATEPVAGQATSSSGKAAEEGTARPLLPMSLVRYAERTREPLLVEDATRDGRFSRDPYLQDAACCSVMVVPILAQGEPRAMLLLENRLTRSAFTTARLDAVRLIAGQLSVSIENALLYARLERKVAERTEELARANERLERMSHTDALTGLPNRRRLDDILEAEWQRALRDKSPLAVAMIDIDQFKLYNDHYGHPAGDRCLHQVASTLAGSVRCTDHVARYGGEEFCIVMPGATLCGAVAAAERTRIAVEELAEPHTVSTHGTVTISIGIALARPDGYQTPGDLVRRADQFLYQAKENGRNRTVSENGPG